MTSDKTIRYFIRISIICVILLFIWDFGTPNPLTDITFNPLNTDWSVKNFDINSIIQTLLSALLGFLFAIVIIESVINKTREKEAEAKQKEIDEKKERWRSAVFALMDIPVSEYAKAAICITNVHPFSPDADYESESITLPVEKNTLLDIYRPALYVNKILCGSKIEFYLDSVERLQTIIRNILLNVDFSYNPDLSKLLIDYLNDSYKFLYESKKLFDKRDLYEKTLSFIDKIMDKPIKDIASWELPYPFAALAELIEIHDKFFHAFLPEIQYNKLFGIK